MAQDLQHGETIRNYQRAFERDRRLHSIPSGDRPIVLGEQGIPVTAFVYGIALVAVAFVLLRVPIIGDLMGLAPAIVWYVVAPVMLGYIGAQYGDRNALALHRWVGLEVRHRFTPRVRHGGRAVRGSGRPVGLSGKMPLGPDHHGPQLQPARITGPGRVLFGEPVGILERHRRPSIVRPLATLSRRDRARVRPARAVDLDPADVLEIRP